MRILIFGDSLAAGLDYFPAAWDVHIESFPGETTTELLQRDEKEIGLSLFLSEEKYDVVVVIAGTNDVGHQENISTIVNNLSLLVELAHSAKHVVLMSIPYCPEINRLLSELDYSEYCDFFEYVNEELVGEDGLHLNEKGKKICCEVLGEMCIDLCYDLYRSYS